MQAAAQVAAFGVVAIGAIDQELARRRARREEINNQVTNLNNSTQAESLDSIARKLKMSRNEALTELLSNNIFSGKVAGDDVYPPVTAESIAQSFQQGKLSPGYGFTTPQVPNTSPTVQKPAPKPNPEPRKDSKEDELTREKAREVWRKLHAFVVQGLGVDPRLDIGNGRNINEPEIMKMVGVKVTEIINPNNPGLTYLQVIDVESILGVHGKKICEFIIKATTPIDKAIYHNVTETVSDGIDKVTDFLGDQASKVVDKLKDSLIDGTPKDLTGDK